MNTIISAERAAAGTEEERAFERMLREGLRVRFVSQGQKSVQILHRCLSSHDEHVRWEAAKALSEIGGAAAMEVLAGALQDESLDVRWVAAEGLIEAWEASLEPVLHQLIAHAGLVAVRESARWIIGAVLHERDVSFLKPVLHALNNRAPIFEVPLAAYEALVSMHRGQARLEYRVLHGVAEDPC